MLSIIFVNIYFPIVIKTWNSLPDFVVASGTINSFKNNLDKFWFNEEVKYNWKAELTRKPKFKL